MLNIIINADDSGYGEEINRAIVKAFRESLISSATIMANLPWFGDAIQLAHEEKFVSKTGIHINLTEGVPLTDKIKRCRDNGLKLSHADLHEQEIRNL